MKGVNFQRNKSLIRIVNEQKVVNNKNWDRILYLVILILFGLFMLYYFTTKFLYMHAYGHVIIDNTRVRLTDDARILKLYVHEGDSVNVYDTLFTYALDIDTDINNPGNSQSLAVGSIGAGNRDDWWTKELFALKKKIALNDIDVSENLSLISNYQKEIKRISNEVILDILPKNRLEFVQNEMMRLNTENQKLNRENSELKHLIKTTKPSTYNKANSHFKLENHSSSGSNKKTATTLSFSDELLSETKYFKSPMTGIATRIYVHDFETALKSEDIISLHVAEPAFIKVYFEQEDLKYFKINDVFKIRFPDGTESSGFLKRFYIATYTLPEEFQKKYEPTTRSIAADIYPVDSLEIRKWRTFYKMSVDISKFKFN